MSLERGKHSEVFMGLPHPPGILDTIPDVMSYIACGAGIQIDIEKRTEIAS
jgi:hypothetical protein